MGRLSGDHREPRRRYVLQQVGQQGWCSASKGQVAFARWPCRGRCERAGRTPPRFCRRRHHHRRRRRLVSCAVAARAEPYAHRRPGKRWAWAAGRRTAKGWRVTGGAAKLSSALWAGGRGGGEAGGGAQVVRGRGAVEGRAGGGNGSRSLDALTPFSVVGTHNHPICLPRLA